MSPRKGASPGPKTLEHLVDAVLSLEGERSIGLRLLRGTKNRFGSTDEVGVFEMAESGLLELQDPARAFMGDRVEEAAGSVVARDARGQPGAARRGPGAGRRRAAPMPRRTASGLDPNRLALLIAVLGRRAGIGLASHDVYANLAGGLRVDDPALDLPLALALASSLRDRPVRPARSPSARSGCSASCAPSRASTGACARRRGWGSPAPSCPARRVRVVSQRR